MPGALTFTRQRFGVRRPSAAFGPVRRMERARGLAHSKASRPIYRLWQALLATAPCIRSMNPVGRVRPGEPLDVRGTRPTRLAGDRLALPSGSWEVLTSVIRLLTRWSGANPAEKPRLDHAAAELQGSSGALLRWQTTGPLDMASASTLIQQPTLQTENAEAPLDLARSWQTSIASADLRVSPGTGQAVEERTVWLARTDFIVPNSAPAQFWGSSRSPWSVWLNVSSRERWSTERPGASVGPSSLPGRRSASRFDSGRSGIRPYPVPERCPVPFGPALGP